MIVVFDSTVLVHLQAHANRLSTIFKQQNVTEGCISRISYLELLSGASENSKVYVKKLLQPFKVLEFDSFAASVANKMSMKYRVSKNNSKDFLIAAICIANQIPLLTENSKHFSYKELALISYRITVD